MGEFVRFPTSTDIFLSIAALRPSLGPPPPTCPLVTQDSSALKGPRREDDHLPIICLVLKLQMIHGNTLHSPTHFQAVVFKGAAEVGSCLSMGGGGGTK